VPVVRSVTCSRHEARHDHQITRSRPAATKLASVGRFTGIGWPVAPFHSCTRPVRRSSVSGPDPVALASPSGRCSTGLTRRPVRSTAQVGLRKLAGTPEPFALGSTAVCTHTRWPSGLTAIMVAQPITRAGAFAAGMNTTRPSAP
jgi:hypothetical protein